MRAFIAFVAITLPWLNPFTFGPTPSVAPWLFSMACLLVLVSVMEAQWFVQITASAWLVAALASSALGVMQYFGISDWLGVWGNATHLGEAYANLRQRNQYATLTSIGFLVMLWYFAKRADKKPVDYQLFAIKIKAPDDHVVSFGIVFGFILLALGNAASGSRTGLSQWILIALMAAWWQRKGAAKVGMIAVLTVVIYIAALFLLPWELKFFLEANSTGMMGRLSENTGCSSRLVLWSNVLHLIAQHPWVGWGWGELDYAHFITLYPEGSTRFCEILDNAHNLPLHLAVELGIPLALLACGTLVWLIATAKPWKERDPTRQLAWGVLAVIGLHSLLEYPLWYGPFQIAVLLCVVILSGLLRPKLWDKLFPVNETAIYPAAVLIGLFSSMGIALASWDYWRVSQIYFPVEERSISYREDTLKKIKTSWFFSGQLQFAEFTTQPLTTENAQSINVLAKELLHFSPEPRVVQAVVESATHLHYDQEARFYAIRSKAAYGN